MRDVPAIVADAEKCRDEERWSCSSRVALNHTTKNFNYSLCTQADTARWGIWCCCHPSIWISCRRCYFFAHIPTQAWPGSFCMGGQCLKGELQSSGKEG